MDIGGRTVVEGWACDQGYPQPIAVHLYATKSAFAGGTLVTAVTANLPSEPAVAAACGSTGSNYRFQIPLAPYQASFIAQPIFIHGISLSGGTNNVIANSGSFSFPDSIFGTMLGAPVQIQVSAKYAGAINSLYWRGQQFVNTYDHGREIQSAGQFNGAGECYNPTEAGSFNDAQGPTSTSVFYSLQTYGEVLSTSNRMSFWLSPGESSPWCTQTLNGPAATHAAWNTTSLSNYWTAKQVSIGFQGISNVIQYSTQFYIPENVTASQIQGVTGYLPSEFSVIWQYDLNQKYFIGVGNAGAVSMGGASSLPIVLTTQDQQYALAIYAPDILVPVAGTTAQFQWTSDVNSVWGTTSWSSTYQTGWISAGTTVAHTSYLVFGNMSEVKQALDSLQSYFKSIGTVPN